MKLQGSKGLVFRFLSCYAAVVIGQNSSQEPNKEIRDYFDQEDNEK